MCDRILNKRPKYKKCRFVVLKKMAWKCCEFLGVMSNKIEISVDKRFSCTFIQILSVFACDSSYQNIQLLEGTWRVSYLQLNIHVLVCALKWYTVEITIKEFCNRSNVGIYLLRMNILIFVRIYYSVNYSFAHK